MVETTAGVSHGTATGLARDVASFARHCRAGNLSPKTIETYVDSTRRLATDLAEQGMPQEIEAIRRAHVEGFIG